jgi:hypothetical protein
MSYLFDFEDSYPEYPLYSEEELIFYDYEDYQEEDDAYSGRIGAHILSDDSMDHDRFFDDPGDLDYGLIEDMNDFDDCSNGGEYEFDF